MLPDRLRSLTYLLSRLPGVGEKTAQRFALHFATDGQDLARDLGQSLVELCEHIRPCDECGNISQVSEEGRSVCHICRDSQRDPSVLCVVGKIQDLLAVEASGAMRGRYFVLGRLLSPLDGIGPDELPLDRLRERVVKDGVSELILATPPSVDGEATALFLAKELGNDTLNVTRIASGVPHGGELEFADRITLGRAIAGRRGVDVKE